MLPIDKCPSAVKVPTTYRGSHRDRKISFATTLLAADAIGPIELGCEIVVLSKGQFSLIHALNHILAATGKADIDITTWTASTGDIRQAEAWLKSDMIGRLRFVIDPSFKSRKPQFCQTLVDIFGDSAIRTTRIHAKFTVIRNDAWNIAVRTSMNLNPNPRIEMIEISDDPALCAFLGSLVDDIFDTAAAGASTDQSQGRYDEIGPKSDSLMPSMGDLPF